MREIIEQLNEMSFELPRGWQKSDDLYTLPNGQGMNNIANYVSSLGVISLFAVARDPDEFLEGYQRSVKSMDKASGKYQLIQAPSIRTNGFVFPVYIVKGFDGKGLVMVQVFVNCGDCLGCFMVNVPNFSGSLAGQLKNQPLLAELVKILKTTE